MVSLGCILISDLVVANLFMLSLSGIYMYIYIYIYIYNDSTLLGWNFFTPKVFCMRLLMHMDGVKVKEFKDGNSNNEIIGLYNV